MACAAPAHAAPAQVENRCALLSAAEFDELNARVMLRLSAAHDVRPAPSVVCTDEAAWVEWDGRRFTIPGHASLADEVVEIIDAALEGDGRPRAPQKSEPAPAPPSASSPSEAPVVEKPSTPTAGRGGIALGLELELPSNTIGVAVGPSFDFGTSIGPLVIGAREAFRFATSGPQVSFMDFEGLLGYGAPLRSDVPWGVVLRLGAACMVAYPKGSALADFAPTISLGVRGARALVGPASIWLGLDARARLSTLRVGLQNPIVANDFSGSFSLGVSFLDLKRK